jgi:hypothetical protein
VLAAQHADQCPGKRGQTIKQLAIVHFGELFALRI